jgi:hypothetical protein
VALAAAGERVKYCEVAASVQGKPESLSEIARRLLGSSDLAQEIFELNAGRTQPDGGKLANADSLNKGWLLVLPWDAVGDGVRYGELPAAPAPPAAPPPSAAKPTTASIKAASAAATVSWRATIRPQASMLLLPAST